MPRELTMSEEVLDDLERVAALLAGLPFPYLRRILAALAPEVIQACIWRAMQTALARPQDASQGPYRRTRER
jgi:hypothetical protein